MVERIHGKDEVRGSIPRDGSMKTKMVKIITFAPKDAAEKVRLAMGESGAGIVGQYSHCSFSASGHGRLYRETRLTLPLVLLENWKW